MTEKIGNVTLCLDHYPGEDYYCDGAVEDEILSIVQKYSKERFPEIIKERRSWELLYHLSDLRENIVEWLPLDGTQKVLEVGAGCGAITGSLARRAREVTCVELSKKRSKINAWRHKECDNVTIHVGNFDRIEPDLPTDYDYILLIGVFEYGQSYIRSRTPFSDFYRLIKRHVGEGGRIVIAIENKMGLKYWAGCREDHVGEFFAGLEDYPNGGPARTFTRGGLETILQECGEEEYAFYYPYPDYKFMTMLYSDQYLPKVSELSNNLRNFDRDRMLLFDEKKVFDMLIREGLFALYSNSFLVVTGPAPSTVYCRFSNDRAAEFCLRTEIGVYAGGERYVRKYPCSPLAEDHIRGLADNYEVFADHFAGSGLEVNRLIRGEATGDSYVELEFLEQAVTLEELLDSCLQRKDREGFRALFDRYMHVVSWNEQAGIGNYDLIFSNICVQGDVWTMIDYEWASNAITPAFVARRALYCYVLENEDRKRSPLVQEILKQVGLDEVAFAKMALQERDFQRQVMTGSKGERIALASFREIIGNKAVPCREYFARAERKKVQIFEDFGAGYSPEHSWYSYDAYLADDEIGAEIVCKKGLCGLRLDPAEVPCILRIRQICLDGRALTLEEVARGVVTNGTLLQETETILGGSLLFDTADPNLDLRLDALGIEDTEGLKVGVEAEIAWLSQGMLQDLVVSKKGRKRLWFRK